MTQHGIGAEHTTAADAAAWSLLALLLFCVFCFAIGAWVLWRRGKKRPRFRPHPRLKGESPDKLSPESVDDTAQEKTHEPWERDENWWQKPPAD